MPESRRVPEERGPEYPPRPHQLRQGSKLGAKFMAQEEPAGPPDPVSEAAVSTSVGWADAGVIFL